MAALRAAGSRKSSMTMCGIRGSRPILSLHAIYISLQAINIKHGKGRLGFGFDGHIVRVVAPSGSRQTNADFGSHWDSADPRIHERASAAAPKL